MSTMLLQLASHVAITIVAVVGLALRIEHRLTKIETDVTWLTRNIERQCGKEDDDE